MSSVKEKIRKLLNVAADHAASEHEIESCLAKAERLMREHHLGEADLFDDFEERRQSALHGRFTKKTIHAARKCYEWERRLAGFVRTYVGGFGYYSKTGALFRDDGSQYCDTDGIPYSPTILVYYGIEDDVELAGELFSELRKAIMSLAIARHRSCFRGPGASYAQGFVVGLYMQMDERRQSELMTAKAHLVDDNQRTTLTVIERRNELINLKEALARDWLASPAGGSIQLASRTSTGGSSASHEAYHQGRADGSKYPVSDQKAARLGYQP